jgi:hypothetical protein
MSHRRNRRNRDTQYNPFIDIHIGRSGIRKVDPNQQRVDRNQQTAPTHIHRVNDDFDDDLSTSPSSPMHIVNGAYWDSRGNSYPIDNIDGDVDDDFDDDCDIDTYCIRYLAVHFPNYCYRCDSDDNCNCNINIDVNDNVSDVSVNTAQVLNDNDSIPTTSNPNNDVPTPVTDYHYDSDDDDVSYDVVDDYDIGDDDLDYCNTSRNQNDLSANASNNIRNALIHFGHTRRSHTRNHD